MEKELHIIAGSIVVESKLSKLSKSQLLNWIQTEATEAQIKALLLDGAITDLDDQAEEIVNARFEAGGRIAKLRKSVVSGTTSVGGINPIWVIYRKIRSTMSQCTRRCGKYEINTSRRQHCMSRCKVEKYKAMLTAAKKHGNEKEALKMKGKLVKAQAALMKSQASFSSRGAES